MSAPFAAALRWEFPAAGTPAEAPAPALDLDGFVVHLAAAFSVVAGTPVAACLDAVGPGTTRGFSCSGGPTVAFTLPPGLAGAIVAARCGGGFAPDGGGGPSAVRVASELDAAVLCAADAAWPGQGGWSAARPVPAATHAVRLDAGGHAFVLALSVVPAAAPAAVPAVTPWTRSLRAALDATPFAVRAVLHDRLIPLGEALAMRAGDILPIDTRRDVALRLGDRGIARGTITDDGDGGHRVTIVAVGPAGVTLPVQELS